VGNHIFGFQNFPTPDIFTLYECSCYTDGAKRGGFSALHSRADTSHFKKNKMRTKHPFFFFLLLPHLTHTPGFFFFFFFSSSPSPLQRRHLPATVDPAVTHHFRPNHLRRLSSFPAKPNRKTSKNSNPTSKIVYNASKIDYNATKFVSNASKLKPRGES
jgi:hypothetical protein